MATKGEIARLKVSVDVDVNKASLAELQKSLKDIQNSAKKAEFQEELTDGLKQAAIEAQKVSDILTKSWNTKLNQMDLTKLNKNIKESYGSVDNLKKAMMQGGEVGAAAYNRITQSVLTTNVQLKQSNILLDKMAITMSNTIRFGISSAVFNKITDSISEAYSYVKRLDSSLNDIRIVSNASADEMERFAVQANKAAKALGTSTLDYTNASLIYYQQGITEFEEIQERTDATLKLANTTGETASSVSDYMTAIWNNFDDGSKSLEYYADVLAKLGAETASSSDEIAAGLEKFASVSETVGLSYEYATSALTTITAATRQSADVVGTALKTLFSRIQDLELGNTLEDGTTLGKYSEALEKVGINIKTQTGDLKDMDDILDEMGAKWGTLNKDQQVALAQAVAGVRQYNQLMALMNNWSDMELNIERANDATGTLNKQQAIYAESMEAHLQRLSTEAEKTYSLLFDEDALKSFASLATKLLATLNSYITGLGGGLNALGTIAFKTMGVFSNQIGGLVQQRLENQRAQKTNESNEQVKQNFANELGAGSNKGLVANEEALNKQIEYYNRIKTLKGSLNEEDVQELNNSLSKIGQLKERVAFLENYKDIAEDINKGDSSKEGLSKSISQQKKYINDLINSTNEAKKAFEDYNKVMTEEGNVWPTDEYRDSVTSFFDEFANYQKEGTIAAEDAQKVMKKLTEGQTLSQNDLDILLKGYNQDLETSRDKLYQLQGVYQACVDTENGMNVQLNTQLAQEEAIIEKKIQQKKEQQEIAAATRGLSLILSTITSINGISDTLKNEDLDRWEKFKSIASVVLVQGFSIAKNWKDIGALFSVGGKAATSAISSLAVQLGVVESSAVAAEMSAGAMWTAMLGPIALIIAGVAAVGVGIYALVKAYNADADAAKQAAEQAEVLTNRYQELQTTAEELKQTISDYSDAIEQMKSLDKQTEEYTTTLEQANKKAKELIETYKLYDKYHIENGVITFDEGTLESIQEQANSAANKAESEMYAAKIASNQASLKSQTTDTGREIGSVVGTGTYSDYGNEYTRKLTNDELTETAQALNTLKTSLGDEYDIIASNKDKLKETLLTLTGVPNSVKENIDAILKNKESLLDLASSMDEVVKSNMFYSEQIMNNLIENKYGNKINKMATVVGEDGKAIVDEGRAKQIQAILAQQENTTTKALSEELSKIDVSNIKRNSQLEGIDNDKDLAKTYAKEVLGYEDTSKMTYKGGWNKGTLKDETGQAIVDEVSDDVMRQELARVRAEAEIKDSYAGKIDESSLLGSVENIIKGGQKLGEQYGTDFTDALLNSITAQDGKVDLSGVFADLSPSEYLNLSDLASDPKRLQETMGLTDEDLVVLGENWAEKIQEGLVGYEWNMDDAITNAIKKDSKDLEENNIDTEEIEDYAKQLMVVAKASDGLDDSLSEQADTALDVAKTVMIMNDGIENLAENWEEWDDILKKSSSTSEEYAEAIGGIRKAMSQILGVEESAFTNDFLEEHFDQIAKAANGDEDAIESLRNSLQDEIIGSVLLDSGFAEEKIADIKNQFSDLADRFGQLDLGITLQGDDELVQDLQKVMDAAQMTEEESNQLLQSIGMEPTYEQKEMPETKTIPTYEVTPSISMKERNLGIFGTHKVPTMSFRVTQSSTEELTGKTTLGAITTNGKTPKIKTLKKVGGTGSARLNNYSSANKGGKSAGGGGSSKETKYNTSNDKTDIYQEVNTQLQSTNDELKKIQSQTDKLTGLELIQNINKQIQNLNKNLDLTNKKLRIAQGEQQGFISQLQGYGVGLNADGSINQQSYVEAFYREQSRYTSATTEDEAAKKRWEDFKQLITDYNNSVKNIDSLKQNIQDSLDKITDLKIQAFNMEIEVTLDLDDARKQWEEFKKDVIDKIEDDDILGNAQYNLDSLNRFYDEQGLGKIQEETKYLTKLLNELKTMDATGSADSYDKNRKKALEDLQKYYEQTMSDLTDIEDVIDEIEKSLGETLDDISDQMQDQLKAYEQLSDTLDHDMKLIQLVFGEDSYSKLEDYYAKKEQNLNSRLDFQKQQVEFWEQQMTVLEEGSKEWEKARDNWMSAVNDWQSNIESAIENLQDKYLNAINAIFDNLNNQLTNGKGLAYINEEWELINKNADRYLDTINSQYGIQTLQQKYLDAIDETSSLAGQKKLTKLMNEQVEALKAQDKLSQADLDRADLKYQIAVKRLQLEEAQQNKSTMRLRRDSQGNYSYQYTADEDETSKLESELSNLYNQLYNFDKDQYTANLEEMYAIWEEYQQKMTEAMQINDPEQREARKLLITQQYEELINGIVRDNEKIKQELHESTFLELADLYDEDYGKYASLAEAEQEILMDQMIPQWNTGIQEMIDKFAGEGGFGPTCEEALNKLAETTEQYETDLGKLQEAAAVSFEEIAKSIDPVLEKTGQLVKDNDALFSSYQKQVDAINNVLNALRNLTAQYEGARKAASDAAEASYKYWEEQQRQAQAAAAKNDSAKVDQQAKNGGGSGSSSGGSSGGQYSGYRLGGRSYTIRRGDTLWGIARSQYGNAGLWSEIWNNNRGNLRSGNPNLIYPGEVIRLDTGGYTGEWNSADGKLAMLHQKELVLNAQDTENILSAVSMMRSMLSNIGSQSLGQIQNSESAFEQNVHIEASFPNVSSTHEIEAALNNLVNAATQHIHNNKR